MTSWNNSMDASGQAVFPGNRVLAAVGLVYFAPVLLAVAVLIKCGSPGPVFSKRVGRGANGDRIAVWEFRTVAANAGDSGTAIVPAAVCTNLGAFLRDSRLERLPRLLNILRGELPIRAMFKMT